jgi:hypothetical protein
MKEIPLPNSSSLSCGDVTVSSRVAEILSNEFWLSFFFSKSL